MRNSRTLIVLGLLFCHQGRAAPAPDGNDQNLHGQVQPTFFGLPLSFEENHGQHSESVRFVSRGQGYQLFVSSDDVVVVLNTPTDSGSATTPAAIRMGLTDGNPTPETVGNEQLPGRVNYLIGNDPKKWRTNIPTFARVERPQVYPGIDMVLYGNQGRLEFDFNVAPGVDPSVIGLEFSGAECIKIAPEGDLLLSAAGEDMVVKAPVVYQEVAGVREQVPGSYVLENDNQVRFRLGAYDLSLPLTIDPVLVYSTYLGGADGTNFELPFFGIQIAGIAVDSSGNAYVTGATLSVDFPLANPFQSTRNGNFDAFVTKLNADGSGLIFSTYLGGGLAGTGSRARSVAVDPAGNAYVTGNTNTSDFPTFPATVLQPLIAGGQDAFVTKLSTSGSLVYSTYLGGTATDDGYDIALDPSGNAYVTGETTSGNFPTTPTGFQLSKAVGQDSFVAKISVNGEDLEYGTYLGGDGFDFVRCIAVDTAGRAYVAGGTFSSDFPLQNPIQGATATVGTTGDAVVTKLDATGSALVYSTYLGGNPDPGDCTVDPGGLPKLACGGDAVHDIAVDASGNAYLVGQTESADFPITAGAFQSTFGVDPRLFPIDTFVTKLKFNAAPVPTLELEYSTYLGDTTNMVGSGIAVDAVGNAYVAGSITRGVFPDVDPLTEFNGDQDALLAKLDASGSNLLFFTGLSGDGNDNALKVALDASGSAYVFGTVGDTAPVATFPTTAPPPATPFQPDPIGVGDYFVVKVAFAAIFTCVGFDPPLDTSPVKVKKNRVLPLKAEMLDSESLPITDLDVVAPPVIQVLFSAVSGDPPIDVTDDALPAGQGTEGNQFEFSDERWRFNLKTKNYTAAGTYTISMVSGDASEYVLSGCSVDFVIEA